MRRHDPEKFIYDALEAVRLATKFVRGKNFSEYVSDELLRSAVERQLSIIGEALNSLCKLAPEITDKISDYRRIIGFRNILVRGYDIVEDETVWGLVKLNLPTLHDELATLLDETGNPLDD